MTAQHGSFLATRRGRLTLLLCAVQFLDVADSSIMNVALPSVRREPRPDSPAGTDRREKCIRAILRTRTWQEPRLQPIAARPAAQPRALKNRST